MVWLEQEVDKEVLTEDEQSAYWYQRYTLRHVMDGRGQPLRNQAGQPRHDVPSFLEPVKETILTTGESSSPPLLTPSLLTLCVLSQSVVFFGCCLSQ